VVKKPREKNDSSGDFLGTTRSGTEKGEKRLWGKGDGAENRKDGGKKGRVIGEGNEKKKLRSLNTEGR